MARPPFLVNVATLRREGPRHEHREGPLDGLGVTGSHVPAGADVAVDAVLEPVTGGVMVHATVTAPWEGECRRCLGSAAGRVDAEVRELYEPHSAGEDTYSLSGDELDLEPLARDAVLLELPQTPLCSEGCRGLCPTCGADLNRVSCGCPPAGGDPRWAALDSLHDQT